MMEIQHSVQRTIEDIKNDDSLLQITGYVQEIKEDNVFILDDKSGVITINCGDIEFNFKPGDLINVVGTLNFNVEGNKSLEAEFIQDMKNLNFKYYIKLYHLKKEFL